MRVRSVFLAVAAVLGMAAVAAAAPINPLGGNSPAGEGSNISFANITRGWSFTVNIPDVTVTQLGYVTPLNGGVAELVLWDNATDAVLASVPGLGGTATSTDWEFFDLASPVALTQGASYTVGYYMGSPTVGYYFANGAQFKPGGDISFDAGVYCNTGCSASSRPSGTAVTQNFGLADIGYVTDYTPAAVVPLPATGALLVLGLGALALRRRRSA